MTVVVVRFKDSTSWLVLGLAGFSHLGLSLPLHLLVKFVDFVDQVLVDLLYLLH